MGEDLPEALRDMESRAKETSELLDATQNAFAETLKHFAIPADVMLDNTHTFDQTVERYGMPKTREDVDSYSAAVTMVAATALRQVISRRNAIGHASYTAADVSEYFQGELDKRLRSLDSAA